jgi:hypothetical protein
MFAPVGSLAGVVKAEIIIRGSFAWTVVPMRRRLEPRLGRSHHDRKHL